MLYLANAFSLGMLKTSPEGLTLRVRPISLEEAKNLLGGFESVVGHPATSQILTTLLGVEVPVNRVAITLSPGDRVIVFQLGVRLEEGRILNEEEVLSLYREGKASFSLVEVL
jgi:hypothetical protein